MTLQLRVTSLVMVCLALCAILVGMATVTVAAEVDPSKSDAEPTPATVS